jgi:putative membrane protein
MPRVRVFLQAAASAVLLAVLAAAVALLTSAPAGADTASVRDTSYLRSAAASNLAEIEMAKVALQRSHSSSVRQLATTISSDHKTAEAQLAQVAAIRNVTLPTGPNPQQLQQIGELQSVSPSSFDVTYLQTQIGDHQTAIANTKAEIATGADPTVVEYARGALPVLQKHLDMSTKAMLGVAAVEATAPATNSNPAPSNVVSSGPEAFGAKSSGSDDTGWLIGLAVVAALAIGAVLLWFRHTAGPNRRV